jgi:hypothetical protein
MSRFPAAGALLLTSALAGCGGGIPASDFPGVPLLVVVGQVISDDPLPPLEVGLVAQLGDAPSMTSMVLEGRTDAPLVLQGTPPVGWFALVVFDPPRSPLRPLREGEVLFARGNAVAMPFQLPDDQVNAAAGEPWFGADVTHWIVYLDSAAPPGSLTAWWLGAPAGSGVGRGYHLLEVRPFAPCQPAVDACVAQLSPGIVPDAETARPFCEAPYRLFPADNAVVEIHVGTFVLPDPPACSP